MSATTATLPLPTGLTFSLKVPFEGETYSFLGFSTYRWSEHLPFTVSITNASSGQLKGPHFFDIVVNGHKVNLNLRDGPTITLTYEGPGFELPPIGIYGKGFGVWLPGPIKMPMHIPSSPISVTASGKEYTVAFKIGHTVLFKVSGTFIEPVSDFYADWVEPTAGDILTIKNAQGFTAQLHGTELLVEFEQGIKVKGLLTHVHPRPIKLEGNWPGVGIWESEEALKALVEKEE